MSAEEDRKDEPSLEQSEIRRPQTPKVKSALHHNVTAKFGSDLLTVPKLGVDEIQENPVYESRPAVLAKLDLKKRPILSHHGRGEGGDAMADAFDATLMGASSTSEPPPDMGQTLPLPEALRAAAQAELPPERDFRPLGETQQSYSEHPQDKEPSFDAIEEPSPGAHASTPTQATPEPVAPDDDSQVGKHELMRKLGEEHEGVQVPEQLAESGSHQEPSASRVKRTVQIAGVIALIGGLLVALGGLYVVNQARQKADEDARIAQRNEEIAERRLVEQIEAERKRRKAESERRAAQKKAAIIENRVKLSAEELAEKNAELRAALEAANRQVSVARAAQGRAQISAAEARDSKSRSEKAARELKVLLDEERERSERLNERIETLLDNP